MNKYKEAFERIFGTSDYIEPFLTEDDRFLNVVTRIINKKDYLTLKELVEKATLKKPKYTYFNNELVNYHCPQCGEAQGLNVNKRWNRFCPCCGQALDWSEKK